ncbi:MAG: F0F1 ATP synthase subunit epsilon [Candidatus Omnitrophica bacterium]|nr:F0F1 ATP synthase subunit epsilon [Candidatus Omnitrophota bacterium]
MADKGFALEILTPEKTVFSAEVISLIAPAAAGYLGVLANHAPLVATLTPGKIICRDPGGTPRTLHSTGSGFLEVHHNRATILLDEIGEGQTLQGLTP